MIGYIACCSCYRIRAVTYFRRFTLCIRRSYCEKTDSEVVVELCVMSSVMSMVSTIPADRVTVSSCHGSPDVVTLNVVAESVMSPLGVTFVPDHDE